MPALMAVLSKIPGKSIVEETIFLTDLWLLLSYVGWVQILKLKK